MAVEEDSQQLRQLARAVMAGELTRDEYRRQRRVVIDRHAGDAPVATRPLSDVVEASPAPAGIEHTMPNTNPTVPYRHPDDVTQMAGERRRTAAAAPEQGVTEKASGTHHDLWIGIVAVVLVLLLVGGLLAWFW